MAAVKVLRVVIVIVLVELLLSAFYVTDPTPSPSPCRGGENGGGHPRLPLQNGGGYPRLPSLQGEGLGVRSVLLFFMFAFNFSKSMLQRYAFSFNLPNFRRKK
jgi:hypothetical protein